MRVSKVLQESTHEMHSRPWDWNSIFETGKNVQTIAVFPTAQLCGPLRGKGLGGGGGGGEVELSKILTAKIR